MFPRSLKQGSCSLDPYDIFPLFPCSPKPLGDPQMWSFSIKVCYYWVQTIFSKEKKVGLLPYLNLWPVQYNKRLQKQTTVRKKTRLWEVTKTDITVYLATQNDLVTQSPIVCCFEEVKVYCVKSSSLADFSSEFHRQDWICIASIRQVRCPVRPATEGALDVSTEVCAMKSIDKGVHGGI